MAKGLSDVQKAPRKVKKRRHMSPPLNHVKKLGPKAR